MVTDTAPRARHRSEARAGSFPIRLVIALLLIDALLLLANGAHLLATDGSSVPAMFSGYRWHGDNDRSFIELWGHLQLGLAALVLFRMLWTSARRGLPGFRSVYAAWGAVFVVIVIDDFLMVHEKVGAFLAGILTLPAVAGLRPVDLGELLVWGILAIPLGLALLILHRRATGPVRARSRGFMYIAAGLAVVAVGVDMLHSMMMGLDASLRQTLTFVETGGELLAMTLFLVWSVRVASPQPGASGTPTPTAERVP